MSFNLEKVEINDIISDGDSLKVITERETREFEFSEIKDLEVNEIHQDDNSGAFATIGTIVGLIAGDFTGAISGGFTGWVASKIFSKEKLFTITFTLNNNELFP